MGTWGVAGLMVVAVVLVLVAFRSSEGLAGGRSDYTRVVVPPGSAGTIGKIAADSGVPAPDPLPSRDRARVAMAATAPVAAACAADGGGCDLTVRFDCDPRKLRCRRSPPQCAEGQVPSVAGSCFGECVPIEACRCTGPEQCPSHEQYTCLMSAQHCTPYLH